MSRVFMDITLLFLAFIGLGIGLNFLFIFAKKSIYLKPKDMNEDRYRSIILWIVSGLLVLIYACYKILA